MQLIRNEQTPIHQIDRMWFFLKELTLLNAALNRTIQPLYYQIPRALLTKEKCKRMTTL